MTNAQEDFYELLHKSRLLVVDDDEDLCLLIQRLFANEGYSAVDAVHNGRDAMTRMLEAAAEQNPYDLLLLDLRLPGDTSGQEIYRSLCQSVDISVVVLSVVDEKEAIVDALKSGSVEEYLIKPVDLEVLFLKCERILSRRLFNRQVHRANRRNQMLFLNILQVMAKVLEAKDPYTKFHSEKVAKYSRQIGGRMGYDGRQLELLQIAGILHDFGKIGIKETVLNKPGSLTSFEYETVKRHPLIASAILEPIEELRYIIRDIRHHHEWWNGQGYPDGLQGEDIPLGARILCVADSYDAMTSSRSYHEPLAEDEARAELIRCKNVQFDPQVVDAFVMALDDERLRREKMTKLDERRD